MAAEDHSGGSDTSSFSVSFLSRIGCSRNRQDGLKWRRASGAVGGACPIYDWRLMPAAPRIQGAR